MKIEKKIKILLALLCVSCFCFHSSLLARGMTDDQLTDEIKQLNDQISNGKDKMKDIEDKKAEYTANIATARAQVATLKGQLDLLDNRIAAAEIDIEDTQNQIDQTNLEMKKISVEMEKTNGDIAKEKDNIATTLKLIYKQNDAGTLEVLLMNSSLSEFLDKIKYLDDVNRGISDSLDTLKTAESNLENQQADMAEKDKELKKLKGELEQNKMVLESDKQDKEDVMAETNNSAQKYKDLVAELKAQQDAAATEISDLEKTVRDKMSQLDKNKLVLNSNGLIWPVPKNIVTTYFHDPDYPFRYLFEHPGIDIRAAQKTTIVAAASGYVAHAKMNGNAYAYVMLIHGNGLSTVYGHVTKILVNEDDYVVQGQPIALSGGLPGTAGSGPFTTGPHLHLEVRQDGIPVNPLEYLSQ
jgi:murein DD-endopeptidase MepM/ murein hydrolase activator NlpD